MNFSLNKKKHSTHFLILIVYGFGNNTGQALVARENVMDAGSVKDRLEKVESKWTQMGDLLTERQGQLDERQEKFDEYNLLYIQVRRFYTKSIILCIYCWSYFSHFGLYLKSSVVFNSVKRVKVVRFS